MSAADEPRSRDFLRTRIDADVAAGKNGGRVHTRFPPEPNGYLHIGHAKAVHLNYGIAQEYGGLFNMRFDDTNPEKESTEYVEAILEDVRWLGAEWGERLFYASDWFGRLYEHAVQLVRQGDAFVCDLPADDMSAQRGAPGVPGQDSPFRGRSVDDNLDLLERMRQGEFAEGSRVLRARIDMAHSNLLMRDPVMYRIRRTPHHRTGSKWCIYPTYDWAHGQCDSYEGITHSLCTLEFENHRPLYDWFLDKLGIHHPQQIEFARLNLDYTVMSKRKLLELVQRGLVAGWDDPRMPTIRGMRRRGYTAAGIRKLCDTVGVARFNSTNEVHLLEHCVRDDLNKVARRAMAVMDPLEVVVDNWPDGHVEWLDGTNNPEDPAAGSRKLPFRGRLLIERDDFLEDPPKKFFRLSPGREVRLRFAYFLKCEAVEKDARGQVVRLRCTYDPDSIGVSPPKERGIKSTIHWVAAEDAVDAEVRLYESLLAAPDAADHDDWLDRLNPDSLTVRTAKVEPSLADAEVGAHFQFERIGYFCVDRDSKPGRPVFNRTVTLRDDWARQKQKQG